MATSDDGQRSSAARIYGGYASERRSCSRCGSSGSYSFEHEITLPDSSGAMDFLWTCASCGGQFRLARVERDLDDPLAILSHVRLAPPFR